MSRTWKKPYVRDSVDTRAYWRTVRRTLKVAVKQNKEILPKPQEIINDWDYCDYKFSITPGDEWWHWTKDKKIWT